MKLKTQRIHLMVLAYLYIYIYIYICREREMYVCTLWSARQVIKVSTAQTYAQVISVLLNRLSLAVDFG